MDTNPAETHVEVDSINYYTLLEPPPSSTNPQDAPLILLIHALMSNLHMWDALLPHLHAAGYTTLRYDHPGHHNTPPPHDSERKYHLDELTRHAHQIVKARTGRERVQAVLGCSIGGSIAFRYAQLFGADVDGGIVAVASPGIKAPEAAAKLWEQRLEQFEEDRKTGGDVLCRATVERWFPGDRREDDEVRAESLRQVKTCGFEGYKVLADAIRDYDYGPEIKEIGKVRTLVVAGEEDQAGRADILEEVAGRIPGAEFVCMEKTGHLPPMQRAGEFGKLVARFLQR